MTDLISFPAPKLKMVIPYDEVDNQSEVSSKEPKQIVGSLISAAAKVELHS